LYTLKFMSDSEYTEETQNYYQILGLNKRGRPIVDSDIMKNYYNLTLENKGNPKLLKKLENALLILVDPEKKKLYDNYGTVNKKEIFEAMKQNCILISHDDDVSSDFLDDLDESTDSEEDDQFFAQPSKQSNSQQPQQSQQSPFDKKMYDNIFNQNFGNKNPIGVSNDNTTTTTNINNVGEANGNNNDILKTIISALQNKGLNATITGTMNGKEIKDLPSTNNVDQVGGVPFESRVEYKSRSHDLEKIEYELEEMYSFGGINEEYKKHHRETIIEEYNHHFYPYSEHNFDSYSYILTKEAFMSLEKDYEVFGADIMRAIPQIIVQPINLKIGLSLTDLYFGKSLVIPINKQVVINGGGQIINDGTYKCVYCVGKGFRLYLDRENDFEQVFKHCDKCQSKGYLTKKDCRIVLSEYELEVCIARGTSIGDKITLRGLGHQDPAIPDYFGDIEIEIVKKEERSTAHLVRRGNDIYCRLNINVMQSLHGIELNVFHPSGEMLYVNHQGLIKPNSTKLISNYGMPFKSNPKRRGDFIFAFDVYYPFKITDEQKKIAKELNESLNKKQIKNKTNFHKLEEPKIDSLMNIFGNNAGSNDSIYNNKPLLCINNYDSDDDTSSVNVVEITFRK
jgi:DnaJ-class molecular chaperone